MRRDLAALADQETERASTNDDDARYGNARDAAARNTLFVCGIAPLVSTLQYTNLGTIQTILYV